MKVWTSFSSIVKIAGACILIGLVLGCWLAGEVGRSPAPRPATSTSSPAGVVR